MKYFKVIIILGVILLLVGINLLYFSFSSEGDAISFDIPAGADYYNFAETDVIMDVYFYGDYTVSHGVVDFYILDEEQYKKYIMWGITEESLFSKTDTASGHFSTNLPSKGKYYIVADHGSGFELNEQGIEITYRMSGIDFTYLIAGLTSSILGIILLVLGSIKKKATTLGSESTKTYHDVKIFNNK